MDSQTYPNIEHLIVSDGPDPELAEKLPPFISGTRSRYFFQLPYHEEDLHWGHLARLYGLEYASGELIGYLDDDDAFRSGHVELLVAALGNNPDSGWAYSRMMSHMPAGSTSVIGEGPPSCGNIGTPMIAHRRETLEHGTWEAASAFEDWELVNGWTQKGIKYSAVEEVTVDVWPSVYYGPGR